jgi:ADP-ribose pyrophosphatase YjhB (NUDIX family)
MSETTRIPQQTRQHEADDKGFTERGYELEDAYRRYLDEEDGAEEEFVQIFKDWHADLERKLGLR